MTEINCGRDVNYGGFCSALLMPIVGALWEFVRTNHGSARVFMRINFSLWQWWANDLYTLLSWSFLILVGRYVFSEGGKLFQVLRLWVHSALWCSLLEYNLCLKIFLIYNWMTYHLGGVLWRKQLNNSSEVCLASVPFSEWAFDLFSRCVV